MGTFWIYVYGWFFHITGKWLGGNALNIHIRAAFAWSKVPLLINLSLWMILLIFSAEAVFIRFAKGPEMVFIYIILCVSGIWSLAILIQCIREVQGFSLRKAVLNVFLGYFLTLLLLIALFFLILPIFVKLKEY